MGTAAMVAAATEQASRALSFQIVVAATRQLGIGKNGSMPWKLPADMAYFKTLTSTTNDRTKTNAVVCHSSSVLMSSSRPDTISTATASICFHV